MHTQETKDRFLELRAKGRSLADIADALNVSKRTLVDWNRELQTEIHALRAVEREALHHRILDTREADIDLLASIQKKISSVLADRDLVGLRTKEVLRLYLQFRHEAEKIARATESLYDNLPPSPPPSNPQPPSPPETPPAP
jgi:hypothetical protein